MMRKLLLSAAALAAIGGGLYATGMLDGPGIAAVDKVREQIESATKSQPKAQAENPGAPTVTVIAVELADFVETLVLTGTLVPREEVLIATEVEGFRIVEVLVDESRRVQKGDVLVRLETASLDAQLAQNDAQLARADAAIAQAKSAIDSAQAKVREAANALDRAKPLRQSGILADATFDQRESAARSADATLVSARDGLKLAIADKALIEAQRRDLAWKRGKTEIRAPVDGIVSRRNAKVGQMASGQAVDPLFRLIAGGEIELDAEVPETQLGRLQVGQNATIAVAGLGDVKGTVRIVSPEIDRQSRLGRIRILVTGMEQPRIGSFARASVVVGQGRGLALPAAAVQFNPEGTTAQVVVDGRVATRKIVTGLQSKGLVEIKSGVVEGDQVVARAGTFVRDGDVVRAVKAPTRTSGVN